MASSNFPCSARTLPRLLWAIGEVGPEPQGRAEFGGGFLELPRILQGDAEAVVGGEATGADRHRGRVEPDGFFRPGVVVLDPVDLSQLVVDPEVARVQPPGAPKHPLGPLAISPADQSRRRAGPGSSVTGPPAPSGRRRAAAVPPGRDRRSGPARPRAMGVGRRPELPPTAVATTPRPPCPGPCDASRPSRPGTKPIPPVPTAGRSASPPPRGRAGPGRSRMRGTPRHSRCRIASGPSARFGCPGLSPTGRAAFGRARPRRPASRPWPAPAPSRPARPSLERAARRPPPPAASRSRARLAAALASDHLVRSPRAADWAWPRKRSASASASVTTRVVAANRTACCRARKVQPPPITPAVTSTEAASATVSRRRFRSSSARARASRASSSATRRRFSCSSARAWASTRAHSAARSRSCTPSR